MARFASRFARQQFVISEARTMTRVFCSLRVLDGLGRLLHCKLIAGHALQFTLYVCQTGP